MWPADQGPARGRIPLPRWRVGRLLLWASNLSAMWPADRRRDRGQIPLPWTALVNRLLREPRPGSFDTGARYRYPDPWPPAARQRWAIARTPDPAGAWPGGLPSERAKLRRHHPRPTAPQSALWGSPLRRPIARARFRRPLRRPIPPARFRRPLRRPIPPARCRRPLRRPNCRSHRTGPVPAPAAGSAPATVPAASGR